MNGLEVRDRNLELWLNVRALSQSVEDQAQRVGQIALKALCGLSKVQLG